MDPQPGNPIPTSRTLDPNYPEVSGTSLPLLSALLAGFAVTSVIQLVLSRQNGEFSFAMAVAITAFLLSVLSFVTSIVFSVKAQASNYLPFLNLGRDATAFLEVADTGNWLKELEARWLRLFQVAIFSFYFGTALFLLALDLTIWVLVGRTIGVIFLLAALAMVGFILVMDFVLERRAAAR